MVWVRRSRHRDTAKVVDEVRRNATIFLHQADPRTSRATAHERLHGTHREKKRRWEKAGWGPVSKKAAAVCATFAVVRESRRSDHSGVSHYRLPTNKSAEVVR